MRPIGPVHHQMEARENWHCKDAGEDRGLVRGGPDIGLGAADVCAE